MDDVLCCSKMQSPPPADARQWAEEAFQGCLMANALDSGTSGLGSSPGRDTAFCSWVKYCTLVVPLFAQVYKWIPAQWMLGVALWWTSIPSSGVQKYSQLPNTSFGLRGHLARIETHRTVGDLGHFASQRQIYDKEGKGIHAQHGSGTCCFACGLAGIWTPHNLALSLIYSALRSAYLECLWAFFSQCALLGPQKRGKI